MRISDWSSDVCSSDLDVPWLHVAGNHDMDTDAKDDADALQTFRRHFGPDTFAREEALATFVLLDDVIHRPGMKPAYTGGFREDQFAFRSEEHTSELQSLMRISYAVFCLKKQKT